MPKSELVEEVLAIIKLSLEPLNGGEQKVLIKTSERWECVGEGVRQEVAYPSAG